MTVRRSDSQNRKPNRTDRDTVNVERLQKVLAAAGIGSRRECEELILEGRVEVDGEIVQALGTRVDPMSQRIRVDGTMLPTPKRVYYMLNKPTGVLCTNNDPSGRARAVDLIRSNERLFTVGRLDQASEGLILLTNDGELANRLTHPRYGVEKVYRVRVAGAPELAVLGKLKKGIHFADGFAKVSDVKIKSRLKQSTDLEIVLNEGRNREIRRLLARIGHKVLSLTRIAMGPLRLADLPSGAHRALTRDEIKALRNAVPEFGKEPSRAASGRSSSGRSRSSRASAKPKPRPSAQAKFSDSPAKTSGSIKPKPRDQPLSNQPKSGAILGGDEVPEMKKANKSSRPKKATSRNFGKRPSRGKPPKKGRR